MTGVFMKNDKFVIFDRDGVINIEKSRNKEKNLKD